jgi:starvation-inducible DNA-binding protein
LFDEQAESIFSAIDILAERVRRIGGTTIRSVGHIRTLRSIKDDDKDFVSPEQMIRRLLDDNRGMAVRQRAAIEMCHAHRDSPTANILQDVLYQTEKRIWFLHAVSDPSSK